mgnify:CR=1 FL=1
MLRAVSGTFLINVMNAGVGFLTGIAAARLLMPDGRGELAQIVFWGSTALALGMLALPAAVAMAVAEAPDDRDLEASSLVLAVFTSLVAVLIFVPVAFLLVEPDILLPVIAYTSVLVPAGLIGQSLSALAQGRERFMLHNFYRLIPGATYAFGILLLWLLDRISPTTFVAANGAGFLLVVLSQFGIVARIRRARPRLSQMKKIAWLGVTMHASSIVSIVFQRADQALIIYLFDREELGFYAIAMTLSAAGAGLVTVALSIVSLPMIMRQPTFDAKANYIRVLLGTVAFSCVAITLPTAVLAPWLVPFLFGPSYAEAVPLTMTLCVAQIPIQFFGIAVMTLRTIDDWKTGVLATLVGLILFVPLAFALSRIWQVEGIAVALAASWMVASLITVLQIARKLSISPFKVVVPPFDTISQYILQLLRRP